MNDTHHSLRRKNDEISSKTNPRVSLTLMNVHGHDACAYGNGNPVGPMTASFTLGRVGPGGQTDNGRWGPGRRSPRGCYFSGDGDIKVRVHNTFFLPLSKRL
ncbi:hypothetical protein AMTR_s00142p00012430 [Amborella trichopoda]|uniref:Uncharacterized protein n=1 Tax=Amborella trichopoda TaxID=13333 RepID=W1P800_AMBTC|nr:hypothetical protein AMTR_s00142p00012430 [Amborella trichopoda]